MGQMTVGGDLSGIGRCPHCSIANPQLKQLWISEPLGGTGKNIIVGRIWACYQCTTCGSVVLACCKPSTRTNAAHGWNIVTAVDAIYPSQPSVDAAIPEPANRYLTQAHETLHAPDAAAVMAASSVDAMLKNRGYNDGSLYTRIDKAVQDHLLTDGMGKWAHAVRLEANNVRHADDNNPHVTPEQAKQVVEFASALGDFLYVLTAKISRGVKAAETPQKITK